MSGELRKFVIPEIVVGVGARHLVGAHARGLGARRVLLVSDPGVSSAGWTEQAAADLRAEGIPFEVFTEVVPNPRAEEVMAGAELHRRRGCDVIVAVGGGSPIDCAKGIGIVAANRQHVLRHEGADQVPLPGPPLICVPTTAGTSADVSQFVIITDQARRMKAAIISKTVVPTVALVDPETTLTMAPYLTACTGIDALTHAIEALVSNASSPLTELHALEAIRLVGANLLGVLAAPADLERRTAMTLASLHAGLAFSNASLGAVHAMAHSLGGALDLAHGECNAILLGVVVGFNFAAARERYLRAGAALGLEVSGASPERQEQVLVDGIARLRQAAGVTRGLGSIGVGRADLPMLAENAMRDVCMVTNPRRPTLAEIVALYEQAL